MVRDVNCHAYVMVACVPVYEVSHIACTPTVTGCREDSTINGWPLAAMRRRSHGEWGRSANEIWVAVGTHCGMCTQRVGKESVVSLKSRRLHGRLRSLSGKYGCCAGAEWFQWGNGFVNTYGTWPRMLDTRHGGLLCERIGTVTVR